MWQRFTERARKTVFYAQEEAGRLGENYVSTEHLLLGLVRDQESVAARILEKMGISLSRINSEIERQVARGDGRLGQDMQLTPRAKRVIDLAYDESRQLNDNYIGTEHLLLGMIREGEGLAGRVLLKLGADLDRTRKEVLNLQERKSEDAPPTQPIIQEAANHLRVALVRLAGAIAREASAERTDTIIIEHDTKKTYVRHGAGAEMSEDFVLPFYFFDQLADYYKEATIAEQQRANTMHMKHEITEQGERLTLTLISTEEAD